MAEGNDIPDAEELSRHREFARRLAFGLVRDAHLAEDLAQDAIVVALVKPPRRRASLPAWIGRVVRNLARMEARGGGRRRARETAAARPEASGEGPAVAATARLETARRLASAVLELEEPYRSVVVLRHYEGLSTREIASRLDVPVATVRTRLRRAHEQLRPRLERDYGDSRSFGLALLALLGKGERRQALAGTTAAVAGGLAIMGTKKLVLAAAALLLLAGGGWLVLSPAAGPAGRGPAPAPPGPVPPGAAPAEAAPGETAATEEDGGSPDAAGIETGLQGRVVDGDGRGIAGARVFVEAPALSDAEPGAAAADEEGRYVLACAPGILPVQVLAVAPGFAPGFGEQVTVASGLLAEVPDLVLRPGATISGRVLGPSDSPVAGAEVSYGVVSNMFFSAESVRGALSTVTGEDGRYTLRDVLPATIEIRVLAKGYAIETFPAVDVREREEKRGIDLHLVPEAPLRVRVVSDEGVPIEGASIRAFAAVLPHPVDDLGGGNYVVHGFRPGGAWIDVEKPGFSKAQPQGRAGGDPLVVTLNRLGSARVRVVDEETGETVLEKVVGDLEWGKTRAHLNVPGYGFLTSDEFVLERDRPVPEVTIRARRLRVVTGRVLDGDGRPVPGAWVDLKPPGEKPSVGEMAGSLYTEFSMAMNDPTDREGRFRIEVLKPGTFAVYARSEDHPITEGPVVKTGEEDVRDVVVTLRAGGTIEGEAPADAFVTAIHRSGEFAATVFVREGRYRIPGVPTGEVAVTFHHQGGGNLKALLAAFTAGRNPADPDVRVVEVGDGVVRVDFEPTPAGTLLARFTEAGSPATGLDVRLVKLGAMEGKYPSETHVGRTRSDEHGEVRFEGLDPGDYGLVAARSMLPVWFEVVTIESGKSAEIAGKIEKGEFTVMVIDAETGGPLPKATIRAVFWAARDGRRIHKQFVLLGGAADERGFVTVEDLPPGRYRAQAMAPDHEGSEWFVVEVKGNETNRLDPIRLKKKEE